MSRQTYLDNAATTAVRPEVVDAITPFLGSQHFGNPSSAHALGRKVRAAVEEARGRISAAFDVDPERVVFTSGGTEADNLAVLGVAFAARAQSRPMRVAVSAIEHKAVLDAASAVERLGGERLVLPVDTAGHVIDEYIERILSQGAALVSVMWVNNETGTVQDIAAIDARCVAAGVPFHTDAVQAVGKLDCRFETAMMATISGHKIGAPKGVGALILADHRRLEPLIHGGGQQAGVRPGTENVVGIVGLGVAVELAVKELQETAAHTGWLRTELESRILATVPGARVNGAAGTRAPHISNISIPGIRSDVLMMHLDMAGIYCSTGSACNTRVATPSHVLRAMGIGDDLTGTAVRFSFSRDNDSADLDHVLDVLPGILARVRNTATRS